MESKLSPTGCNENHFYSFPFGQAEASIYQPRRHFNQPQKLFVLLLFKFLIKHYLPVGKLKREFTSPIAKSTSPRLSDSTFFARCPNNGIISIITPLIGESLDSIFIYKKNSSLRPHQNTIIFKSSNEYQNKTIH